MYALTLRTKTFAILMIFLALIFVSCSAVSAQEGSGNSPSIETVTGSAPVTDAVQPTVETETVTSESVEESRSVVTTVLTIVLIIFVYRLSQGVAAAIPIPAIGRFAAVFRPVISFLFGADAAMRRTFMNDIGAHKYGAAIGEEYKRARNKIVLYLRKEYPIVADLLKQKSG